MRGKSLRVGTVTGDGGADTVTDDTDDDGDAMTGGTSDGANTVTDDDGADAVTGDDANAITGGTGDGTADTVTDDDANLITSRRLFMRENDDANIITGGTVTAETAHDAMTGDAGTSGDDNDGRYGNRRWRCRYGNRRRQTR